MAVTIQFTIGDGRCRDDGASFPWRGRRRYEPARFWILAQERVLSVGLVVGVSAAVVFEDDPDTIEQDLYVGQPRLWTPNRAVGPRHRFDGLYLDLRHIDPEHNGKIRGRLRNQHREFGVWRWDRLDDVGLCRSRDRRDRRDRDAGLSIRITGKTTRGHEKHDCNKPGNVAHINL